MEHKTIGDAVLEQIRTDILSGKLHPGERLKQAQLAKNLGVSIIPLREALKRLEAEGYVIITPHRHVSVKGLSSDELEDLYIMRRELESLAAELAAEKLTDTDKKEIRQIFQKLEKATRRKDSDAVVQLNKEFHSAIYRACGRKHLLSILEELWERSSRYRRLVAYMPRRLDAAHEEHRKILEACEANDKRKLRQVVRVNLNQALRRLQKAYRVNNIFLRDETEEIM